MFFFFNDTATTEIYTLSLHDALPIYQDVDGLAHFAVEFEDGARRELEKVADRHARTAENRRHDDRDVEHLFEIGRVLGRSEEHTSELQSRQYLVCRLLLEKKNKNHNT